MRADEGIPECAERLAADVLRTTGSTLRFQLGDAHDLDEPLPPGRRAEHRVTIASGAVVGEPPFATDRSEPDPVIWIELDGEIVGCTGAGWTDAADVAAVFVDHVQEDLDEEIWGGWPFCPEHAAHLSCDVRDHRAVWLCPRGEVVSAVGDLPSA